MILIVTSIYDFSADFIVLKLREVGKDYVRINKEQLSQSEIVLDPSTPSLTIKDKTKDILLKDIKSIYFRQPVFLRNTPSNPLSTDEQLSKSQWNAFFRSLCVFRNAKWINHPQATYLAESKPYQLSIARECGFMIPDTLIGNDADKMKKHFHNKDIIVKSLDTILLMENNDCLFTYTSKVNKEDLRNDNIQTSPLCVQEYITPKIDWRVTIIENKIYSIKILKNGEPIQEDWRLIPKEQLEYKTSQLPKEVEQSCFLLMEKLNLKFGAIDILESDGRFIFLEINPTGEWGWILAKDRPVDCDITQSLIA